jgi:hypothetical protein
MRRNVIGHRASIIGHRASGAIAAATAPAQAEGWKQGTKEKPAGASARAKGAVAGAPAERVNNTVYTER